MQGRKVDYVSIPEGSDLLQQKKRKGMASGQGALVSAFNVAERDVADKEAARMLYANGLPFNFVRSPYFWKYSLTLANSRSGSVFSLNTSKVSSFFLL